MPNLAKGGGVSLTKSGPAVKINKGGKSTFKLVGGKSKPGATKVKKITYEPDEQSTCDLTGDERGEVGRSFYATLKGVADCLETRQVRRIGSVVYPVTFGMTRVGCDLKGSVSMGRTRPHIIRVRRAHVLANVETGEIFGRVVNHPGSNPPDKFLTDCLNNVEVKGPS